MPSDPKKAGSPAGGHDAPEERTNALRKILQNKRRELLKETRKAVRLAAIVILASSVGKLQVHHQPKRKPTSLKI